MSSQHASPLTLEDLAALNDEISALVRAGVPLDRGLAEAARELPRRLQPVAQSMAESLQQGATLAQAIHRQRDRLPALYAAIVEAGARAGKLDGALAGLSDTARRVAQIRSVTGAALAYPVLVALTAVMLSVVFVKWMLPELLPSYRQMAPSAGRVAEWIVAWGDVAADFAPWLVAMATVGIFIWWRRTADATAANGRRQWLDWLPGRTRVMQWSRTSMFVDLLAHLIRCRVPLPEGIELAAEATGDPLLAAEAVQAAARLRKGGHTAAQSNTGQVLPALVRCLLANSTDLDATADSLRLVADTYRRKANERVTHLSVAVPLAFSLIVAGGSTLVYGLMVLVPWILLIAKLLAF